MAYTIGSSHEAISLITTAWADRFDTLIASANRSLILAAPFITSGPLRMVAHSRNSRGLEQLDLLTNFTPDSLISGSSNPRAMADLVSDVPVTRVFHLGGLHAKAYVADRSRALITSANLTMNGLYSNTEIGVLVDNDQIASELALHLENLAGVGIQLRPEKLLQLADLTDRFSQETGTAQSQAAGATKEFRDEANHLLNQLRGQSGQTTNSVFGDTIRMALRGGSKTTHDIHLIVQTIHPDMCDDSIDRVIDGVHFGKRWKHMIRNAQQHLKRQGEIELIGGKWRLTSTDGR
ncbi:MAG: phospholipase D family protein [Chloroflexi bacterium]|nr:phospholipase D family protein [Chloroflexota bacterium]